MFGQLEFLAMKRLDDELAIDQIFQGGRARFLNLLLQLWAMKLLPEQAFARLGKTAHLRVGNNVAVHDGGDAIDDPRLFFFRRQSAAKQRRTK